MRKTTSLLLGTLAAAILATATPAMAQSKGTWTAGLGVGVVNPKTDNGDVAGAETDIDTDVQPTVTFEYFFADNWGIEVLAALPFEHDISLKGLGKVAEAKQLPPVISLQYHFVNSSKFTPFLGVGLNYTTFYSVDTQGAIAGQDLDLDDSFGVAVHGGVDIAISDAAALRFDVRWADIDTDVELDGADIGTAEVDPIVYGMSYVMKF
jgi:outer membrane protein